MLKKSFKIENSLYPESLIIQAIGDFSAIAHIHYTDSVISIESEDSHEEIFMEFINYIIGLYNENRVEVS